MRTARKVIPALAGLIFAVASAAVAGGCNDLVGVDFGAVHSAVVDDDGGGDDATGGDSSVVPRPDGSTCTPKTCTSLGFVCGAQDNGCGSAIDCGTCAGDEVCTGGQCKCVPTTCPALGITCGTTNDGCGGALDCGACTAANEACQNGKCTCTPQSCTAQGAQCGTVPDGCGGTYDCGMCSAPNPDCGGGGANKCGPTPCVPITCTGHCGQTSDGCGAVLSCPSCTAPQTCGGAGTPTVCGCTPTTCTAQGKNCGSIPDGCGGMLACGTCTAPLSCDGAGTANVCGCTPTTCAALGKNCGAVADGCGGTLNCGTCTGYDTCGGGTVADVCGCIPVCDDPCCGGPNGCGGNCPTRPCCGGGCFATGTMIAMADGMLRPIEQVRPGQRVRSYDAATGRFVDTAVTAVVEHSPEVSSAGIVVVNGTLHVTTNHPIWVDGQRVRADQLDVGSSIMLLGPSADGVAAHRDVVRSLALIPGNVATFDLKVGEPGTYVANGIVVFLKE